MDIRMAEEGDLPAVEAIADQAFAGYVARIGRKPAPMLADYAGLIAAGHMWVAAAGPVVAGFCVLIPDRDHLLLDIIAVAPAHQGQGVGRQLITFAEEHARRAGLTEVRLYTNEAMVENLQLYRHLGYRETGRSATSGFRRVHFAKHLG